MIGLKENVIIGKHIPAGTGMKKYRDVSLNTDIRETEEKSELLDEEEPEVLNEAATEENAEVAEYTEDIVEESETESEAVLTEE